jgi:acetyl esterase/lipase
MNASFAPVRRATPILRATAVIAIAVLLAAVLTHASQSGVSAAASRGTNSSAGATPAVVADTTAAVAEAPAAASMQPASQDTGLAALGPVPAQVRALPDAPTQVQVAGNSAGYGTQSVTTIMNSVYTAPVDCGGGTTCQIALDVYVPTGPGPHPTVVLIRGGPSGLGGRLGLGTFASQLASAGMIVYNADYRDLSTDGGGYPAAFQDVACAIRYARATSPALGGDGMVTLVGHSFGGFVGSVVALDPTEFTGGCLYGGSGRPDAFVGLAGNYDLSGNLDDLALFFGSDDTGTAARTASNPFKYASRSPIPVRLVAGTADQTVDPADSVELNSFLTGRGWNVALTLVPDGTHMSLIESPGDSATSMQMIYQATAVAEEMADALDPLKGYLAQ